jgi:heme exporter protein B
MSLLSSLLSRELRLAFRYGSDSLIVVAFFIVAAMLFPFGIGPDPAILQRIAPGVIWIMALLSVLLSLDRMFQSDFEDGSLELLTLGPHPLGLVVIVKLLASWLTSGVPLMVATPVLALLLNMDHAVIVPVLASMLLGTPTLTAIGAIGAALTLGARRGSVLLSLLVLPLYVPILIFGVGVVESVEAGGPVSAPLLMLAAFLLVAIVMAPLAAAAAIRQAVS